MDRKKIFILSFLGIVAFAIFLAIINRKSDDNGPSSVSDNTTIVEDIELIDSFSMDPDALLPDLGVRPLENAYIAARQNGDRILRFPGTFTNTGDGPLELLGTPDEKTNTTKAVQQIYKKNGSKEERFVGNFIFHTDHDHWHFEDFVEFELWNLKDGKNLDQKLLTTGKVTYCLHDYGPLPDQYPGKPRGIVYPWCDSSADIQGISVGWVDTYLAEVSGQELNITDLADGIYAFRSVVDPQNRIAEKDENNNSSTSYIKISGNAVDILEGP